MRAAAPPRHGGNEAAAAKPGAMPTKLFFGDGVDITVRGEIDEVARKLGSHPERLTMLERIHGDEHHAVYVNPTRVLFLEEVEVGHLHGYRR